MHGFLGTEATFREDFNLIVQISMGVALLIGRGFARRKNFKAHRNCQATVVLLNLFFIFLIMEPSFRRQVFPHLADVFHHIRLAIPLIHAALGTIAELLGIYIVLVAATRILPEKLRFKHYKPWMKTELALWWTVILLGIGIYLSWYVFVPKKIAAEPISQTAGMVRVSNFDFNPKTITIPVNGVVRFVDENGRHKVVSDDGSYESPDLISGSQYEHRFTRPGTFPYHCDFHGDTGGVGMSGIVVVK